MAASREATLAQSASESVGIRSKTWRIAWTSLEITDTCARYWPASAISTSSPSRSRNASRATVSRSSTGVAAVASANARRVSSSRASKPSGVRSVSSASCPSMPRNVAEIGSRAAYSST